MLNSYSHLKKQPSGFDYFLVLPGQGRYHAPLLKSPGHWEDGSEGGKPYAGFSTDVITGLSVEWLKNRDPEKPFFLMAHFKATHEPFDYPERWKELYEGQEIPEPASLYDFGPDATGRSFVGQKMDELARRWMAASRRPDSSRMEYPGLPFTTEGLDSVQARKKLSEVY